MVAELNYEQENLIPSLSQNNLEMRTARNNALSNEEKLRRRTTGQRSGTVHYRKIATVNSDCYFRDFKTYK